jgi:DNA-binding transcriptional LysR family regulator
MALARTRHFSRAAELQHVSQPTFSRRIKLLEEAMGATLINRQTLPLSLTPAGEVFVELCERVTRDVRETKDRISDMESEASARISVRSALERSSERGPLRMGDAGEGISGACKCGR